MDWFQIGKEYVKYCHPVYVTYMQEYFLQNARLDEAQTGISIARRNINNLRYTDDTTLRAESEVELKSLLIKVRDESEKAGLKLFLQKTNIIASGLITSWQIEGEKVEACNRIYFPGLQNHCGWLLQP